MKKLFLMRNPELFQGEKYINTNKNYFEGWYFKNSNTSFMISIADIPFKVFNFRGIICDLIIDNKEFRFATYNNTKLVKYSVDENTLNIDLRKGNYYLNIKSNNNKGLKLFAPV